MVGRGGGPLRPLKFTETILNPISFTMPDTLHICFATMTGNAESLAGQAEVRAQAEGIDAVLHNLVDLQPADLTDLRLALFVVSTWGDGEPPDDATGFWYDLEKADLALPNLHYAVFGLGDKDYADFNGFGRQLDERLAALGATRLLDRFDADLDFDDTYPAWENRVFARLAVAREASTNHS